MPQRVIITEIGLRDGLQHQPRRVSTDDKLALAEALIAAGGDFLRRVHRRPAGFALNPILYLG